MRSRILLSLLFSGFAALVALPAVASAEGEPFISLLGKPYEKTVSGALIVRFGTVPSSKRLVLGSISCSIQASSVQAQTSLLAWGKPFPTRTHIVYLPQTPVYGDLNTGGSTSTPTSYVVNLSFLGYVEAGEDIYAQVDSYRLLQPSLTCTLSGTLVPS